MRSFICAVTPLHQQLRATLPVVKMELLWKNPKCKFFGPLYKTSCWWRKPTESEREAETGWAGCVRNQERVWICTIQLIDGRKCCHCFFRKLGLCVFSLTLTTQHKKWAQLNTLLPFVVNGTLTGVGIIPLDWGMTTRRSVLRLLGTTLLPGGGSGGGGDLGGMIFPKLLPPCELTKPFTKHKGRNERTFGKWWWGKSQLSCHWLPYWWRARAFLHSRNKIKLFFLFDGTVHLNVELSEGGGAEKVQLYIIQETVMNNWALLAPGIT